MKKTTVSLSPQDNYVGLERLRKLMFDDWKIVGGSLFCDAVEVYLERERQETKSEAIERLLKTPLNELDSELFEGNGSQYSTIAAVLRYLRKLPDE